MTTFLITIDNIKIMVKPFQKTIYQVLNFLYYNTSHFCYNKNLFISGNCRMCLVEFVNVSKPIVSCAVPVTPNSIILTKSAFILKARENILEFLLLNHPNDCPICDQGGECDLQEYSLKVGQAFSKNIFEKKNTSLKNFNFLLLTSMNRCINCTKCIRLSFKIGINSMSLFQRSSSSEIYNLNFIFKKKHKKSFELISNLVDICPVMYEWWGIYKTPWPRRDGQIMGILEDAFSLLQELRPNQVGVFNQKVYILILKTNKIIPLNKDEIISEARFRFKEICRFYKLSLNEQIFILVYKNFNLVNRVDYFLTGAHFTVFEVRKYYRIIEKLDSL